MGVFKMINSTLFLVHFSFVSIFLCAWHNLLHGLGYMNKPVSLSASQSGPLVVSAASDAITQTDHSGLCGLTLNT